MPLPFVGLLVGVKVTTAVRRLFEHFFPPADHKKPPGRKRRDESQESPKAASLSAALDINPEREVNKPGKTEEEENCTFVAVDCPEDNVLAAGDNAPSPVESCDLSAVTDSSPFEDICIYANGHTSQADEGVFAPAAVDITPPRVDFLHPVAETDNLPLTNICGFTNVDSPQDQVKAGGPLTAAEVNVSTKVESRETGEETEVNIAVVNGPRSEETSVSTLVVKDQLPEMVSEANVASCSPSALDNHFIPYYKVLLRKKEQSARQKVSNANMLQLCHQYPPVANCEQMPVFTNRIEKIINLDGVRNLKVLSLERSNINNLFGLDILGDTLEELWISFNQIETLLGIECLKNLKILHMSKNMVKEWAEFERLGTLPRLTELVFIGNPLEEKHSAEGTWMDQVFQRLPNLLRLDGRFRSLVQVNGPRSDGSRIFTAVDDALVLEEESAPEVENVDASDEASFPPAVGKDHKTGGCGVSWVVVNIPEAAPLCGATALDNVSPLEIALGKLEKKIRQKVSNAKVVKLCNQNPPVVKMSDCLSTLTNCETLFLSKNCIEKITGLDGLRKLKILSLERNKIKALSGLEAVADTLEELWISFNWIERLEGIQCLKHLKVLHMSKNMVKEWAEFERLAELPRLRELVFVGNPLEKRHSADATWIGQVFKKLPNLVRLDGRFRTFSPFNVVRSKNTCVLAAGDNGQELDKCSPYTPHCGTVRKKVSYAMAVRKTQERKKESGSEVVSKMSGSFMVDNLSEAVPPAVNHTPATTTSVAVTVDKTGVQEDSSVTAATDNILAAPDQKSTVPPVDTKTPAATDVSLTTATVNMPVSVDKAELTEVTKPEVPEEDGVSAVTIPTAADMQDLSLTPKKVGDCAEADSASSPVETWELAHMDSESAPQAAPASATVDDAPTRTEAIVLADPEDSPTSMDKWELARTDTVHAPEEAVDPAALDSDLTPITNNGGAHTKTQVSAAAKDAKTSVPCQVPQQGTRNKRKGRKKRSIPKAVS